MVRPLSIGLMPSLNFSSQQTFHFQVSNHPICPRNTDDLPRQKHKYQGVQAASYAQPLPAFHHTNKERVL